MSRRLNFEPFQTESHDSQIFALVREREVKVGLAPELDGLLDPRLGANGKEEGVDRPNRYSETD